MTQYIMFSVLVLAVFVAKLLWRKFVSNRTKDEESGMTERELSEYTDLMMVNALKIAIGFIDRGVPRDEWENNLQELTQIMMSEGGLDEDNAVFLVNAARDFLNEHGDQPHFLRAMLEGAKNGFSEEAASDSRSR